MTTVMEHLHLRGAGVRLHAVAAGTGPTVLLLHGFPDFWYTWRLQLPALAARGFRAIALDLRGYNTSDKPRGVRAYDIERLAADVAAVVRTTADSPGRAHVVGHDWGGVIAWHLAAAEPQLVDRLVVLNAPHPARFVRALRSPMQLVRSSYVAAFQLPWLPEWILRARGHALLRRALRRGVLREGAITDADLARYAEAFEQPGALTAALNYYRAALRRLALFRSARVTSRVPRPTLVLWGDRDPFLGGDLLLEGLDRWVPDLRVERIATAGHWVHLDEPERVNDALIAFLEGRPHGG